MFAFKIYLFLLFIYILTYFVLKQSLILYPWLAWSSLCRPGWPGAHYVDQAGLELIMWTRLPWS